MLTRSLIAGAVIAVVILAWTWRRDVPAQSVATRPPAALAAAGRVEGRGEAVDLRPAVDGVLAAVTVQEGDEVRAGQPVAAIECRDLEAQRAAAAADVREHYAARERLVTGGREDVRAEARAAAAMAAAAATHAVQQLARQARLFDAGAIARADLELAQRNHDMAAAALERVRQQIAVADARPRHEDLAVADAAIAAAQARRQAADVRAGRCVMRSPIDGVVVRRRLEPGEFAGTSSSEPVLTIADLSSMRVRVEVDERDIGLVHVGQRVELRAAAFGTSRPCGHVTSIGREMGRRQVQSSDPADKADRDVLEVLVDVESRDARLIKGLRVTAVFAGESDR